MKSTYREGWEDSARYFGAMIRSVSWDDETRKRLYALASLILDVAPDVPPPPEAEWRAKVPGAVEAKIKEAPAP